MKDILMVVHTMGNLQPTDNDRYTYLAKMLMKENAKVEIVTSDFEHHKKSYRDLSVARKHPFKISFLHENSYKKNVSIARILGHISFSIRLSDFLKNREKPDVIYCAVPPTVSAFVAARYAKKQNIKFVIDVQDLWPESFYIVLGKNKLTQALLTPIEYLVNQVYKQADSVVAVSDTYVKKGLMQQHKMPIPVEHLFGNGY